MSAPDVWFVLPARRNYEESTIPQWRGAGYRVAICREPELPRMGAADIIVPTPSYLGWPRSVSLLINRVLAEYPETQWFVAGGDDTLPDPESPSKIAYQCGRHFGEAQGKFREEPTATVMSGQTEPTWTTGRFHWSTFGVMQPTGDDWSDSQGRIIERVAGSPWIGSDFARRMYQGAGPLHLAYFHNHADEELQCVAQKLGVFWQRRDVTHRHNHWARQRGLKDDMPAWAARLHTGEAWGRSSGLFARRKAAGFPGHEPLEVIL